MNVIAADCKKLSKEVDELRKELNETKSQLVVIEYKRETDIQNHDRKAQEEIASLQQLVQGNAISYHKRTNNQPYAAFQTYVFLFLFPNRNN